MTEGAPPPKRIVFRADGNDAIGSGHLQRCLTLARRLRDWGCDCSFVCGSAPHNFNALVSDSGFVISEIEAGSQLEDAASTIEAVSEFARFDVLVVDHYGLGAEWEKSLRAHADKIIVIDDLANREHDCDLLLDPAPGSAARYDGLVPSHCQKLLGPRYAMLRPEFAEYRDADRRVAEKVERILISFGGVDPDNLSAIAIAVVRGQLPEAAIDVVLTKLSPHRQSLLNLAKDDAKLAIHVDARNMAELMLAADIAIGAGGSTSWERACLGLPSIVVVIADNQAATAKALVEAGCALAVKSGHDFTDQLTRAIQTLRDSSGLRTLMRAAAMQTVDGRGTDRVARAILPAVLQMREATAEDSRQIWEWRNAPEIRATAVDASGIAWNSHQSWFARQLADPESIMLMGEDNGAGIGVVRFNVEGGNAHVSIFLAPSHPGRGFGHALLTAGQDWVAAHRSDVQRFYADVRPENRASIALFAGAGYGPRLLSFERDAHDAE
jgi:UDP-2,4-diacetamido-2,4,6-trideoxy-beta-L-altropyranose hydrolase